VLLSILIKKYWSYGVIIILIGIIFGQNYYSREQTGKLLTLNHASYQEEIKIKEKFYEKQMKEKDEIILKYTELMKQMDNNHLKQVLELSKKQDERIKQYEILFKKDKNKIKQLLIKHYNLEHYE